MKYFGYRVVVNDTYFKDFEGASPPSPIEISYFIESKLGSPYVQKEFKSPVYRPLNNDIKEEVEVKIYRLEGYEVF